MTTLRKTQLRKPDLRRKRNLKMKKRTNGKRTIVRMRDERYMMKKAKTEFGISFTQSFKSHVKRQDHF